MESPTSVVSTASSSGEKFAHTMRNPLLKLLFHEHISSILLLSVDEFDLAKIAFPCQFALDLVHNKESAHISESCLNGHHCVRERVFYDVALLSHYL